MSILDDFKIYCRDKGKYNVTDFNEILGLFSEFESERKSKKDYNEEGDVSSQLQEKSDLGEDDSEGYFSSLFANLKK